MHIYILLTCVHTYRIPLSTCIKSIFTHRTFKDICEYQPNDFILIHNDCDYMLSIHILHKNIHNTLWMEWTVTWLPLCSHITVIILYLAHTISMICYDTLMLCSTMLSRNHPVYSHTYRIRSSNTHTLWSYVYSYIWPYTCICFEYAYRPYIHSFNTIPHIHGWI